MQQTLVLGAEHTQTYSAQLVPTLDPVLVVSLSNLFEFDLEQILNGSLELEEVALLEDFGRSDGDHTDDPPLELLDILGILGRKDARFVYALIEEWLIDLVLHNEEVLELTLCQFDKLLKDLQVGHFALQVLAHLVDRLPEDGVLGEIVVVHLELLSGQEDLALASDGVLREGFFDDELAVLGKVEVGPGERLPFELYPPDAVLQVDEL